MYFAYDSNRDVGWEGQTFVGWWPTFCANGDELDIPAREITTPRRTASDVPVNKGFGVVYVVFKPRHINTLTEEADAVNAVLNISVRFPDPVDDCPVDDD